MHDWRVLCYRVKPYRVSNITQHKSQTLSCSKRPHFVAKNGTLDVKYRTSNNEVGLYPIEAKRRVSYDGREKKVRSTMKTFFVLMALLLMTLTLSSCNMLSGAGKDIGQAGDAVRDATN